MRSFKAFSRIITALSLTVIMCLNFAAAVMADTEEGAAIEVSDTEELPEETEVINQRQIILFQLKRSMH